MRRLASLSESLRDQARLPAINTTAQQNRRFTTRDLPNVWVIQGVIDGFDRRWLYTMRDLELSLTRTMLEAAPGKLGDNPPPRPRRQTRRTSSCNMAGWSNGGRGTSPTIGGAIKASRMLAPRTRPARCGLPERTLPRNSCGARNLATPEDFKPRIESYYEEMYRDLAK